MFEFLRPCKKNSDKKKTDFAITHCLEIKKCNGTKTVTAEVYLFYDEPETLYDSSGWTFKRAKESVAFKSLPEVEVYIERLKLLTARLEEVRCAMKAEE